MNQMLIVGVFNMVYLLLGNIVCFITNDAHKSTIWWTLCAFVSYFILTEMLQFWILVIMPAWRSFSLKSIITNRYFKDHNRKRMNQMLIVGVFNMVYLLLGNIVCFITNDAHKSTIWWTLCAFVSYFSSV